jgi:glycosyltransferase involved in cell wall biosynthesis
VHRGFAVKVALQADQLWFRPPGGIGTYVRELANAFHAEEGVDLTLFHCRFDGRGPGASWLSRFVVSEVPGTVGSLYPRWALLGRPRLPLALRDAGVVHVTNPSGVAPAGEGQALVVTVHDLAFEAYPDAFPSTWRRLYRAGAKAAVRRADAIVVPSHATAGALRGFADLDPAKVHVTPLAASLPATTDEPEAALARLGVPRPYLLFVGTLEPRKQVVTLIRAYRQVAPDVPHALVLAGQDGWLVDETERELARTGPGTIVRLGGVDDADLDALYRGADAFAYPSAYEGFGLPVLEAMARGVPVVTSDTLALSELAADAALIVPVGEVAELAEAIARVLTEPALAADLRARGAARAAGYSWASTARATLDVYRDAEAGRA